MFMVDLSNRCTGLNEIVVLFEGENLTNRKSKMAVPQTKTNKALEYAVS